MKRSSLARRVDESVADHVLRLLADPMCEGVPLAEVADLAGVTTKRAREIRGDDSILSLASRVAADVGWTERDGLLSELVIAALTEYSLAACDAGRCTHELCARQRREKAIADARRRIARPAHETRFQPARRAGIEPFAGARPDDQSRGALPGRTGSGA